MVCDGGGGGGCAWRQVAGEVGGREEEGGLTNSRLRWGGREDTSKKGKGAGDRRLTDEDGEGEEVDTEADAEAKVWVEIRRHDEAGMTRRWGG